MSILFSLPNEILVEVFYFVDTPSSSDIRNCLFLCKRLYPVVAEAYFRSVELSKIGRSRFISGKISPASQVARIARHTKELLVDFAGLTTKQSDLLLSYFPNLESIYFDDITYARSLSTKPSGKNLLRKIKRIGFGGTSCGHRDAGSPESKKRGSISFFLQYRYRATLTHVSLVYYGRTKEANISPFGYFDCFQNLTHLEFQDETNEKWNFFHILQNFPFLVSIRYINRRKQDKEYIQQVSQAKEVLMASSIPLGTFEHELPTLVYNENLKHVDISLSTISEPYLSYILNNCQRLNTLKLTLMDDDLFTWIDKIGEDAYNQLMSKMALAEDSGLMCSTKQTAHTKRDKQKKQFSRLFRLIHAVRNNRPLSVTFFLYDVNVRKAGFQIHRNQTMSVYFSVMYDDLGHPPRPITNQRQESVREMLEDIYGRIEINDGRNSLTDHQRFEYDSGCMEDEYKTLSVPKSSSTASGLEIIEHFVWISSRDCARVPFSLIEYVLKNCPKLKSMDLSFGCNCGCIKIGHEGCDENMTLRDGHPYLLFSRGEYLHPEQLRLISQYYPNIERIEAGNEGRLPLSLGHHVFDKATLDFTCFKNLKSIAIDVYMRNISSHSQEVQILSEMKHQVHTIVRINYMHGPKSKKPLLFTIWQEDPYDAGRSNMFPVAHAQNGTLEELIEKNRRFLPSLLVVDIYLEHELESLVILYGTKVAIIQPYNERRTLKWTKDHSVRVFHDYFINEFNMNIDHKNRKKR